MPPLRLLLAILAGALVARWRDAREWRDAEASIDEAARLWGQRLVEQDAREDRMVGLAERQVRLGWLSLGVALVSLTVAVVAVAT
jgi:hypothetical protein